MDSCVVPHRSTSRAVLWLTAQIGRDAVLSESYGRRQNSRARALLYATYHAKYILTDANKSFPFTYLPSSFTDLPTRQVLSPIYPRAFFPRFSSRKFTPVFPYLPSSRHTCRWPSRSTQIRGTWAEPQRIVATRLLYRLQYPVPIQVVCKGFTPAHMMVAIRGRAPAAFPRQEGRHPPHSVHGPSRALSLRVSYARDQHRRFRHGF